MRLHIAKIDAELPNGPIFHIYLDGLKIRNPPAPNGIQDVMPHLPVDRTTLDLSVTELVGSEATPPDVSDGYDIWREAYDRDAAGVFTIPVSAIVEIVEETISRREEGR